MMDEKQLTARLRFLAHKLFIADKDGAEFLHLMKLMHVMTITFPQSPTVIEQHGGSLAWAAFREGQLTLVRSIEALGRDYQQKIEAEQKSQMEVGA